MNISNSAWNHSGLQDHHHVRSACQVCQRKKIKCDRTIPCRQCQLSGSQCVPALRRPRSRQAGKRMTDSELRNRITKLESLVETLSGDVGVKDGTSSSSSDVSAAPTNASSPTVGKYLGSSFWFSLTTEVQALRDALEEDQVGCEAEPTSPAMSSSGPHVTSLENLNEYSLIICPPGAVYVMPGALKEPSPQMTAALYDTFLEFVAPTLKVFHLPSLRTFLEMGAPYLGLEASATPNKALKASLWFAAVSTTSETECQTRFGQSRPALLQQCLLHVQVLLGQADLTNTTDMATLQALVTYLVRAKAHPEHGQLALIGVGVIADDRHEPPYMDDDRSGGTHCTRNGPPP